MNFKAEEDGITHINIYSKGKTELGKFLTNFAHTPVTTKDGKFESIEGYWYWLSCGDEKLRSLWGWEAKKYGRSVRAIDWVDEEEFQSRICDAIETKIRLSDQFYIEFKESKLPFDHYYNYNGKIVRPKDGRWVIKFIENLRKELNNVKEQSSN